MQGAKLTISRGLPGADEAVPLARRPEPRRVEAAPESAQAAPRPVRDDAPASDIHLVDYRLAALERLGRLRDKGILSAEELAAEKALVLRLPAGELVLVTEQILERRGPSLLGRLFDWKLLAAGTAAGLAFSYVTAPHELLGLVDRASRLIG
jgi:hypothetical protein